MKVFILSVLLTFSQLALANSEDPFDPSSCSGDLISPERAIELLGNKYSVNLSTITDKNVSNVRGIGRERQKIGGVVGPWYSYPHSTEPLSIHLFNDSGKIGLKAFYSVPTGTEFQKWESIDCSLPDGQTFVCTVRYVEYVKHAPGTGTFSAKITNSCVRFYSSESSDSVDREWVHLIRF